MLLRKVPLPAKLHVNKVEGILAVEAPQARVCLFADLSDCRPCSHKVAQHWYCHSNLLEVRVNDVGIRMFSLLSHPLLLRELVRVV